jgi:hypothetical protein
MARGTFIGTGSTGKVGETSTLAATPFGAGPSHGALTDPTDKRARYTKR